ncbi:MAG: tetratricopeptide repeat protein, partial [Candidatus Omnitrophica bacterium]|nr:tetratricopeptide repeat protein [Candidatus Omnitrophota bacterium]
QLHYYRSLDVLQPNTAAWITLAALIGATGIVLFKTKPAPRRTMLFGLGWFLIALLPMLNIVPLVNEYSTILNFEHFVYIPLIGLLLVLVLFMREWILPHVKGAGRAPAGGAAAVCLLCLPLTWKQNTYWGSETELFTRTLRFQESGRVRILLARALYFRGDYGRAIAEYENARIIMQGYVDKTPLAQVRTFYRGYLKEIYFDLAHCYEALQNSPLAIKMYRQALEIEPGDIVLYNNLAVVYIKEKNFTEAVALLEEALALQPGSPLTRQNLAYCYVQLGRPEAADDLFRNEGSKP